ncbi:fumarylacetoacetate hydrolase family protein [Paenibacillus sp. N1-5-1-14]|uniref:fumarylacetoacetate hydrolase family protein n=1 Tax=Paenibacillus radicibacter TaxID=2972488 RepID=UPI002158D095|nr:fumarylacetoacetate hydrolase family protein [Paenibacillus radicibacter]MCR8641245.1 fumarylacetoacetate hydrolase family protein [Paenibacillus radicibacter]
MKLVSFRNRQGEERSGWLRGNFVLDMHVYSQGQLPSRMLEFVQHSALYMPRVLELDRNLQDLELSTMQLNFPNGIYTLDQVTLAAPIPRPPSVRDFYAFESHVKTARGRRGLDMVPEWYEIPVFYFTNHHAIVGPGVEIERPRRTMKLDYELEIACVIGKEGRNITADEADSYILGYCIMNDWSARDIQQQEVKVGLGPAKGKDFATSLGPYLVTKDELETYRSGDRYDLTMTAYVNGTLLSQGNAQEIHYSFGELIARASEDATLYPGDVIGSGTVGTGCLLELGEEVHRWLEPGDQVELEITGLGRLVNHIKESI